MEKNNRTEIVNELKKDIINYFYNTDYYYSDRLQVVTNEILDIFVTKLSFKEVLQLLGQYDNEDFETLDKGLYEGVLEERGFEDFCRVLLYCLLEQDLYNDKEFNNLQNLKEVNGRNLK